MGLYEGIKDVAKVVQQADNIELYRQLLDLSAQALDFQAGNSKLKEEIADLKKAKLAESDIVWHTQPFITLKSNPKPIYCAVCWAKSQKLIQMADTGTRYHCYNCNGIAYHEH